MQKTREIAAVFQTHLCLIKISWNFCGAAVHCCNIISLFTVLFGQIGWQERSKETRNLWWPKLAPVKGHSITTFPNFAHYWPFPDRHLWRNFFTVIKENMHIGKAELLQEGLFFFIHLFAKYYWKSWKSKKLSPLLFISVLKVEY